MDLWEHKPALEKWDGKPLPGEEGFSSFQGKNGNLMRSPWEFAPCGESGKPISVMLPEMAAHVDDIAFFHAMHSKTNTHGPGCVFVNTGTTPKAFPVRVPGSVTPWEARTRTCRLTLRSPISAGSRPTDKRTGPTDFFRRGTRRS